MTTRPITSPGELLLLRMERTVARGPISEAGRGPNWMTDPAKGCSPENGKAHLFTSEVYSDLRRAVDICRHHCPFLAECDRWATEHNERFHVWGGRIRSSDTPRQGVMA